MKKHMTCDIIGDLVCLSGLAISPDETIAAYMEHRSSREDGKWYTGISLLDLNSLHRVPLVSENRQVSLSSPCFSPDGNYLYFLTDAPGNAQIARLDMQSVLLSLQLEHSLNTAAAEILTHVPHGITRFDVASSRLVFETPLWPEEIREGRGLREMTAEERAEFDWQREWGPLEISEIDYKRDELFGVRDGSVSTLGTVDTASLKTELIPNFFPLSCAVISADGRKICCHGQPHTGPLFSAEELFVLDADGSNLIQLTDDHLIGNHPALFTGDGLSIIYSAWHMEGSAMALTLKMRSLSSGEAVELLDFSHPSTPGFDGFPICRTQHGENQNMMHLQGSTLYFLCAMNGTENLYRIPLRACQVPDPVYTGPGSLHECIPVHAGFVCLWGDDHTMAEICMLGKDREIHPLASSNPALALLEQGEVIHQRVRSRDGNVVIFSTVYKPVPFVENRKYPAVLYLHGGPEVCYTQDFWHELHILAAAGFAVICCDPRGSSGYGLSFCDEEISWSDTAIHDMEDALDAAVSLGFIDPDRVGITGGSYGGYMTCKIIMRTNRFRAAVGQRVFVNKATSYGTGDMGFYSSRKKPGEVVIRDCLMERSRTSIIRDLDKIRTPLLLLHGYNDFRCSFEQSEQMFIGLHERRPEVPVRLVMFPGANHNVSREGLLPHRITHVQEMVSWFDTYLKNGEEERA